MEKFFDAATLNLEGAAICKKFTEFGKGKGDRGACGPEGAGAGCAGGAGCRKGGLGRRRTWRDAGRA